MSQRSLRVFSFLFFFFLFHSSDFYHSLPADLFVLLSHLFFYWFLLDYFYFSYCIVHLCSLNILGLLKMFLVSSQSVPPFVFQDLGSSLLSLFWILFQVDSLSPLLFDFYHVPSRGELFPAFSFCLHCCVWDAFSEGWNIMVPFNCGVFSLWMGFYQCLVKVSWMGKLVSVLWWVELDIFSLECYKVSSSEFCCLWIWYGFGQPVF